MNTTKLNVDILDCMDALSSALPKGCRIIDVPVVRDDRGALSFAEAGKDIPFDVKRVFWIYDVPGDKRRGGHSHNTCSEVVFAVSGSFTMLVDDARVRVGVRMNVRNKGIVIPAGMWCELCDFAEGTVLVVLASQEYDAKGYTHNYDEFVANRMS